MDDIVEFICVKEGGRLRVRITTPGYNNQANCQFPRQIRAPNCRYQAPRSAVSFGKGPKGKFFYRISSNAIKIIEGGSEKEKPEIKTVYGGGECVICMDEETAIVFAPCGHYCTCMTCAAILNAQGSSCPMCRGAIQRLVEHKDLAL